jgi:plasmid stabilization system protein ParE
MVIWTIPARDDLKAIFEYIALDSRFYANKVVEISGDIAVDNRRQSVERDSTAYLIDCRMAALPRTKAVRAQQKIRLEDRLQDQLGGHLRNAVSDCGDGHCKLHISPASDRTV